MINLIPQPPGTTPNYWCTWVAQNPLWYARTEEEYTRLKNAPAVEGSNVARDFLNQKNVFDEPGWAKDWAAVRADLFFCFDDGWDVPVGLHTPEDEWRFGSLILNAGRFPGFTGTPAERLIQLNARILELGWRGAALWVAAQCEGDGKDGNMLNDAACERYWRDRLAWSARAGIKYWKVDWGKRAFDMTFRRQLTAWGRQDAPDLIMEHARVMPPLNNIDGNSRFAGYQAELTDSLECLSFSDVLRSYDGIGALRVPVALDRISVWLRHARMVAPAQGLINCEDNMYMGAALGLTYVIVDIPVRSLHRHGQWPRIDEAVRAVRWQRLAPAFGLGAGNAVLSDLELSDTHQMPDDHWFPAAVGKMVTQTAPAIVSRGMALPVVRTQGEQPFVVAARNPNGASSIAALPRFLNGALVVPACDVEMCAGQLHAPVGIFGRFRSLTIRFEQPIGPGKIWAQDLKADVAFDITSRVTIQNNSIVVPGELIDEIGLSAATEHDSSAPGLVLRVT